MKLNDLADLISIRSYITNLVNSSNIEKSKIRPLLDTQNAIDNAIADGILSEEFKSSLNQPPKPKKESKTEIKSGLIKQ